MNNLTKTPKNEFADIDKSAIATIAANMEEAIKEGFIDPLDVLISAKKGVEIYKAIEAKIRPLAESEARVSKGESLTKYYAEITQAETGVKYDYSSCGDKIWSDLNEKATEITKELKEREKFLQGVNKEQGCFDPETGESWTVKPPIRSGKMGLKITLK